MRADSGVPTNAATGVTIRTLQSSSETNSRRLELEDPYPVWKRRPVVHLHPRQDEHFQIVSGSMTAVVDGQRRERRA